MGVTVNETDKVLSDFIGEPDILEFYRGLGYDSENMSSVTMEVKETLEKTKAENDQRFYMAIANRIVNDLAKEQARVNIRRVLVERLEPYPVPKFS